MALPSEVQQQVYDLLSRSSNLSFVPAEPVAATTGAQALALSPGQRVTAEVLPGAQGARVPVRIGAQQLNLELQLAVRPGQNLELTFVSEDPRPTFAMARPGITAPPVSLTDASRLLSLLVSNEQVLDPRLRSSLQSIGDLLRRTSGESSVLANFLDDFLTYRFDGRTAVVGTGALPEQPQQQVGQGQGEQPGVMGSGLGRPAGGFEEAASKLLVNLARQARFTLVEAAVQPLQQLPLQPGDEVNLLVQGQLPGGRVLAQLAGETLELFLARPVQQGEILRMALVTQQPRLMFALLGQPSAEQATAVSDAARWLHAMVNGDEQQQEMQQAVMQRLQQVVASLPPGSPALAAVLDEAMTYGAQPWLSSKGLQGVLSSEQGGRGEEVVKLLKGLLQGDRLALLEPGRMPEKLLGLQAGQQLKGEVVVMPDNGRLGVRVGTELLEVALPKGVKAGEVLNLFYVANMPPAFLLVRQGKGGDALVSDTGRWISSLLGLHTRSVPLEEGLGVLKTLLQDAPSDPARLEQMLMRGLKESGLFYEAHLARWFSGEYGLEEILREPQGRFGGGQTGVRELAEGGVDQRALPIIKEQLASLQSGQLLFRGELFPGQELEWRIREREARGEQGGQQAGGSWETSLRLSLPGLGALDASLSLNGTRLAVSVHTEEAATATLLEAGRAELVEQMASAGLEMTGIEVRHGRQAQD